MPARPAPPPEVFDSMTRVFGEMLDGPRCVGGMTLPPHYLQHAPQYFPPDAAFPLPSQTAAQPCPLPPPAYPPTSVYAPCPVPCPPAVVPTSYVAPPPLPAVPAPRPGQMPVGTWYREVGAMMFVVDVKDGHLTITMTMSGNVGGRAVTEGFTLTADCYLTRDGSGLVGLLTGVDAVIDGVVGDPAQMDGLLEHLGMIQKAVADKPFALTFRVYDDALVIGNLRLPAADDGGELTEPLAALAGRYKRSVGPLPKAKPVKVTRACDGPTCVPAGEPVRLVAPQPIRTTGGIQFQDVPVLVSGPPVVTGPFVAPPPLPASDRGFTDAPVPTMHPPEPLPAPADAPKRGKTKKKQSKTN